MKKFFCLIFFFVLSVSLPLACTKTYSLGPIEGEGPTPTPACSNSWGRYLACASGIDWGSAFVWNYSNNSVYQYGATLNLAVNCAPETSAGVTMTGPGVVLPLTYSGLATIGGTVYADYQSVTVTGSLTPSDFYTLTTVTSIGSANASLAMPRAIHFDPLGQSVSWTGDPLSCGLNYFAISSSGITSWTGPGFFAYSGVHYTPSPPCSHCSYEAGAQFFNNTMLITGGYGTYDMANGALYSYTN
jgi:hypothetical protein